MKSPCMTIVLASALLGGQPVWSQEAEFDPIRDRHLEGVGWVFTFDGQRSIDEIRPLATSYQWLKRRAFSGGEMTEERALVLGRPILGPSQLEAGAEESGGLPTVLALRLQADMDSTPMAADPASFTWTRDGATGDSIAFQGALIADLYLSSHFGLLSYAPSARGVHVRTAAEWSLNELEGQEMDVRDYYLGLSFTTFPVFRADGWIRENRTGDKRSALQQFLIDQQADATDLGIRFTTNEVTGESQWSIAADWLPVFTLPGNVQVGRPTSINERRTLAKLSPAEMKAVEAKAAEQGKSVWNVLIEEKDMSRYFYVVGADVRLNYGALSDLVTGDEKIDDWGAELHGELSFGRWDCFKAGYKFAGYAPVSGDFFDAHRLFAEYKPIPDIAFSVFAGYEYGQFAPDFVKRDRLVVGGAFKF